MKAPDPEHEASPAGRAELGRIVAAVLAGDVDRAEARRRLARLNPDPSGSYDLTLEALREAVEARTTRRWWADMQASLPAGAPDASARLLQRVRWFVDAEVEALPREEESAAWRLALRVAVWAVVVVVVGFLGTAAWFLLTGGPAGTWFAVGIAVPVGCFVLLHLSGTLLAVAGIVRRQFPAPREPDAVWPFADRAAMEAARAGRSPRRGASSPPPRREASPLPTPRRRMAVVQATTGVEAVRFAELKTPGKLQRWAAGGFVAYVLLVMGLMCAAAASRVVLVLLIASIVLLFGAAIGLQLVSFARYGRRGMELLRPVVPPRDPLAGGADPMCAATRTDAFLAA